VRMHKDVDSAQLRRFHTVDCGVLVKTSHVGVRTPLRASGVPAYLMCSLVQVAAALHPSLAVVEQKVLRHIRCNNTLTVYLLVEGPALAGDSWCLPDLGITPVMVKRITTRRASPPIAHLPPSSRVPPPRRSLTVGEQSSWASVVRGFVTIPR